ncbi:MAG: hypothetical protein ACR2N7_11845, partial [Acidimicrobiia bacterium]
VAVTLGATAVVVSRARAMRERLDAEGVARISASVAADGLEAAGKRLQRSALRVQDGQAPDELGSGNLAAR